MDNWFGNIWLWNRKSIIGILAATLVLGLGFFVVNNELNNSNNPKIYEDEMIVSIDEYKTLVDSVIVLQESMQHLLAGEPQSLATEPSLTTEQKQFMCMMDTEDYKDGYLEVNTVLTCMNLELPKEK